MMINRLFDRGAYHALRECKCMCYLFERDECSFARWNILY